MYQPTLDYAIIEEWAYYKGITFVANPFTTPYPWKAPHVANIPIALRKQRSRKYKTDLRYNIQPVLKQLEQMATSSHWGKSALEQTPHQFWNNQGLVTDYQNWTIYRIALGRLNLFHEGWPDGSGVLNSAGSMSFEARGTPIDNAKWVLTRGMAEVNRITDPTRVLLRVESMEAARPIPKTRPPANTHDTQYNCEIRQFFAVQWGKPHLNELEAFKMLAKDNTTMTYNFNGNSSIAQTNPTKTCIKQYALYLRGAGEKSVLNTRKTGSLKDRLQAYHASTE
ncbi:RxLR effector protein [Phytophthora megakarya]|uniref:RxLR effector protein n=1 Tax=Phytophthora megakarya TaxID=4795 RepID=A0A225VT24_9STRA|nr:RxLR effector protein [Phytophthora megakarya]